MARVKARKDAIVRRSNEGVERWLKALDNCTVVEDHARFETPHQIRVGDQLLGADQIFVNVGARAYIPPLPGLDDVAYLTNSGIMRVDTLPNHLVIIGGGYIGLEFAQRCRRFGSRVTLIEMSDRLIRRESEDISTAVRDILEAEGVEIRLNAECLSVEPRDGGIAAGVACADGSPRVEGSHLLLAIGRRPNTDALGLDAAGLDTDTRGHIRVDDGLRTNVPGIWALGECNGRGAFTHTA